MDEAIDRLCLRPIAARLVTHLRATPVTPNHLTFAGALMGTLAGAALALATPQGLLFASLCLGCSMILDCADGQLARARSAHSELGRVLDGAADIWTAVALHLGLWIALESTSQAPPLGWFFWVASSGIVMLFHTGVFDYLRQPEQTDHGAINDTKARSGLLLRSALFIYEGYGESQRQLLKARLHKVEDASTGWGRMATSFLGYSSHNAWLWLVLVAGAWRVELLAWYLPGVLGGFNAVLLMVLISQRRSAYSR